MEPDVEAARQGDYAIVFVQTVLASLLVLYLSMTSIALYMARKNKERLLYLVALAEVVASTSFALFVLVFTLVMTGVIG